MVEFNVEFAATVGGGTLLVVLLLFLICFVIERYRINCE